MPSSSYSSSSSVEIIGATSSSSARALATDAANTDSSPVAERYASSLRDQRAVDDLCRKHGVPRAYTARPAGKRHACTPPPEGTVCVYAHALEAGMRFPLHGLFSEALTHFGLAPSQIAPNGWRILLGFVVLCHDAGVPPSLAVFRHFFSLGTYSNIRGWYYFRAKDAAGLLFTGLPKSNKGWKDRFFFLTSPEPWPCPMRWGEPPSPADPVLTSQQSELVVKILGARARVAHGTAVDLRTYLCETNLAAAFSSSLAGESPPPPAAFRPTSNGAKGLGTDQSAKKAVASASWTEKLKAEPGSDTSAMSWKNRNREEANSNDGPCHSEMSSLPAEQRRQEKSDWNGSTLSGKKRKQEEANSELSTLPADHSCLATCPCTPPGFDPKPQHLPVPDTHDVDSTGQEAARKGLEHELAAAKLSESILQTVKKELAARDAELEKVKAEHTAERAELEKKLVAQDAEVVAVRGQLKQGKTGLEKAEFATALQQVLASEDQVLRRAEHALEGYQRLKRTPRRT